MIGKSSSLGICSHRLKVSRGISPRTQTLEEKKLQSEIRKMRSFMEELQSTICSQLYNFNKTEGFLLSVQEI